MSHGIVPESTPLLQPEAGMILEKYLIADETLKWADRPRVRWKQDLKPLLPVACVALAAFLFISLNLLHQGPSHAGSSVPPAASVQPDTHSNNKGEGPPPLIAVIFFSALVSAFFGFWCYMMFRGLGGQQLLHYFSLSTTYYGLTDYRLLIVSGKKEHRVLSYHLRSVQDLRLLEQPDGFGTISLGTKDRYKNPFQAEDIPPLILKNIPQAVYVFGLIFKTQDKLLKP